MRTGCAHLLIGENSSLTAVTYYKERVQSSSRSGKAALGPGEPRKVRGTQRGSGDPKGSPREPEGSQGIPGSIRKCQENLRGPREGQGSKEGQRGAEGKEGSEELQGDQGSLKRDQEPKRMLRGPPGRPGRIRRVREIP